MYSVAKASVILGTSVPRLKRLGYAGSFLMEDIWSLTDQASQKDIEASQNNTQNNPKQLIAITTIDAELNGIN